MTQTQKKLFIKTFGCQMNVYDSDRMADALAPEGYAQTKIVEEADLILLNTCHIREKASEKVFSDLGRLKQVRQDRAAKGKNTMIGVAGCVAQAEGEEIMDRSPVVDLVFGPQSYHRLPQLIKQAAIERVVDTEFPEEDKFAHLPNASKKATIARGYSAFLTVQEGCDKFCTFCVVPYTRGTEMSRPVEQILNEARSLAEAGVREITLLGQNVNAYHGNGPNGRTYGLAEMLYALADIEGLDRLRYTTSHPRDMSDELIEAHRDLPELMPYLHLPVQSGSDRILKAMNRQHTSQSYFELTDKVRTARPDIAMSGDFIVGFPGETEEDFVQTLELVKEIGYASAYSFKYSPRPGTPGAKLADQIEHDVAMERLARLQAEIRIQQVAFNQSCVGKTMDILVEKPGRNDGQISGRSPFLQAAHLQASTDLIGSIQKVKVLSLSTNSLDCELMENSVETRANLLSSDVSNKLDPRIGA